MKKYSYLHALFLILAFCTSSKGQNKTDLPTDTIKSEYKDVTTSHGPNRMVRTIRQDRNGNIWLASPEGIIRYDGKSFTNITSQEISARFFSVLEDRKGNFWFSSIGSGVYYYDGKSFRNYTTKEGLANDRVPYIYEDKTGNIWFGTESGASRYDGKSFQNYKMNEASPESNVWSKYHNDVNYIVEDKTGKFWFGTSGNACIYDGKTFTILTNNGKPFWNVRCIIEDKKGNIWLGGNDGLWRYDGTTFTNFTQNFVGYIYEDKNGNIWTTSQRANDERWVLSRYDEKFLSDKTPAVSEINSQYEGNKGMLFGILQAKDGSIWFGSLDGVYRYDGKTITDFKGKGVQK
jgi:ligand-binding sensor domain-containing protein